MNQSFYVRDGKVFPVKNLGWLLRHWKEIKSFQFNYSNYPGKTDDGVLVAYGKDFTYFTDFASLFVCWNFLNRPIFQTLKFELVSMEESPKQDFSKQFVIGNDEWKEINQLEYKDFFKRVLTIPPE